MSRCVILACCLLACGWQCCVAEEPPLNDTPSDTEAFIHQLDSEQFALRTEATAKLSKLGSAALPALEKVAKSGSLEALSRALGIIVSHCQQGSVEERTAAKQSLDRLAAAEILPAKKAKAILEQPPIPQYANTSHFAGFNDPFAAMPVLPGGARVMIAGGGIRIAGRFPIPVAAPAAKIKSVTRVFRDGVTEIVVMENDRLVRLTERADKTITGEITQKQDGKDTTEKINVKNAEELKEKFPVAHGVYAAEFLKAAPVTQRD